MIIEEIRSELFGLQDAAYREFQGKLIPTVCVHLNLHNKAIQKSIESSRISPEQKTYLRSLKVRKELGDGE